jgi:hypothetical protein
MTCETDELTAYAQNLLKQAIGDLQVALTDTPPNRRARQGSSAALTVVRRQLLLAVVLVASLVVWSDPATRQVDAEKLWTVLTGWSYGDTAWGSPMVTLRRLSDWLCRYILGTPRTVHPSFPLRSHSETFGTLALVVAVLLAPSMLLQKLLRFASEMEPRAALDIERQTTSRGEEPSVPAVRRAKGAVETGTAVWRRLQGSGALMRPHVPPNAGASVGIELKITRGLRSLHEAQYEVEMHLPAPVQHQLIMGCVLLTCYRSASFSCPSVISLLCSVHQWMKWTRLRVFSLQ